MAGLQGLIDTPNVGLHGAREKQTRRNTGFGKTDTPGRWPRHPGQQLRFFLNITS